MNAAEKAADFYMRNNFRWTSLGLCRYLNRERIEAPTKTGRWTVAAASEVTRGVRAHYAAINAAVAKAEIESRDRVDAEPTPVFTATEINGLSTYRIPMDPRRKAKPMSIAAARRLAWAFIAENHGATRESVARYLQAADQGGDASRWTVEMVERIAPLAR